MYTEEINFYECTSTAYEDLLIVPQKNFPVFPTKKLIKDKKLTIISFQKYSKLSGLTMAELTDGYDLKDGYAIKELRPDLRLILYDQANDPRSEHTVWHEVGHFRLGHIQHGDTEEIETNFYTSQIRMPNAILREIRERGYQITESLLMDFFGVSHESALKKMDYLKRNSFIHRNQYDDLVIKKFENWINTVAPKNDKIIDFEYDDDMQSIRTDWMYAR